MKLIWWGKMGSVEMEGQKLPVHVKPFLPFQYERLVFDDESGESSRTMKGLTIDLDDAQIQQCVDFIIDAFDGGVAGR